MDEQGPGQATQVVMVATAALLLAAGMLLGGCRRALPEAAQEPVSRTLLGTWTGTFGYSRYDAAADVIRTGTLLHTLTFTGSRWILHVTQVPADGGADRRWAESGTWQVDGGSVTRTWVEHNERGRRVRNVAKTYYWGDAAGDVLFMHPWDVPEPVDADVYARYSRVRNESGWPAQLREDPEDDDGDYWLTLERQS